MFLEVFFVYWIFKATVTNFLIFKWQKYQTSSKFFWTIQSGRPQEPSTLLFRSKHKLYYYQRHFLPQKGFKVQNILKTWRGNVSWQIEVKTVLFFLFSFVFSKLLTLTFILTIFWEILGTFVFFKRLYHLIAHGGLFSHTSTLHKRSMEFYSWKLLMKHRKINTGKRK